MQPTHPSKSTVRAGFVLSALPALFIAFDSVIKLARSAPVLESFAQLGLPSHLAVTIGLIELACLVIYLVPRTAVLGALLLTGYLGGAICTHVRVGSPLLSHTFFPVYVAVLLWGGLYLRDERVRALFR